MAKKLTLIGHFDGEEEIQLTVTFVSPLAVYEYNDNIVVCVSDKATFVAKHSDHVSSLSTNRRAFYEWLNS